MVRAYLVELLRLVYIEALGKYPKDVQIQLLYAQFAIQHLHNPFICVNILRCNNTIGHLGFFEQINYKANEGYLIM